MFRELLIFMFYEKICFMKKMDIMQMENLQGGVSCFWAVPNVVASIVCLPYSICWWTNKALNFAVECWTGSESE
jgi:hypothetical protein